MFLSFLFINKCLPTKKLVQITLKFTHPVLQLFCYFVMACVMIRIPSTFRYISTW